MQIRNVLRNTLTAAALTLPMALAPTGQARAAVFVSVNFAPPVLPVYAQPICPNPGYIWTPGYWAYGDIGYYWVPGVWVEPPTVGYLWTPSYWGFENGAYLYHAGYWGPHVGYYGGINYGFGYGGVGFGGGEWRGGSFFYNRSVSNVNVTNVTNVYNRTVIVNNHTTVAYNGGPGGVNYRPSSQEAAFAREQHFQPTPNQLSHQQFASQNRAQFASVNGGRPGVPAAASVAAFHANPTNAQAAARPTPNGREANQDGRIANGLRSGQMTSGEAARADATQSRIDNQVRNDRQANGGQLTPQQRGQIQGEQNNASRGIYNDNHNANTVAPNAVDNREANQQQRTANGLRSGQMTSGEAARANANQAYTAGQVHNDRQANGGQLNQQQRQQVNREQNHDSRQVNRENHNDREHR